MFGDEIRYYCDDGYMFDDTIDVHHLCQADGTWNHQAPMCVPVPCGTAPQRVHGSAIVDNDSHRFVYQDRVTYECDEGFEWTGDESEETIECTASG